MFQEIPIVNATSELADCRNAWTFDEQYQCWCLEDILYTQRPTTPKFQRMSIFVPKAYLSPEGHVLPQGKCGQYTAVTAPVVFENNAAGYMQMPHTWLGGPRDEAGKYLQRGMVYVTCGCRGRESRDENGRLCGKSPISLIDLKMGLRFLRHNADVLPGDFEKIISVGWSAGGAMSSLLGLTGNDPRYDSGLAAAGAFMEERDDVFAAQIYCPIVDLEHADLAYEWQFAKDPENEDSPAGPAGRLSPFQQALSHKLAQRYIRYFNSLELRDPADGTLLTFGEDGRSGTAYKYLMARLEDSATEFLRRQAEGSGELPCTAEEYLAGQYTHKVPAPKPKKGPGLMQGHAGPGVALPDAPEGKGPAGRPSLGDLVSRPPRGVPYQGMEFPMVYAPGDDKRSWMSWDGQRAHITDLDSYLLNHRRRMKPCTSFDTLGMDSGENQVFGTSERDYMHFNSEIGEAIAELAEEFPQEAARYGAAWEGTGHDAALEARKFLINPMNFAAPGAGGTRARHFRIRVGASDADTAFTVSMALALRLANTGCPVDYALVWDKPHCQADYPGQVCDWIEELTR